MFKSKKWMVNVTADGLTHIRADFTANNCKTTFRGNHFTLISVLKKATPIFLSLKAEGSYYQHNIPT